MIESGFKQEMNFQMYAAMKNNVFRIVPHKLSRACVGISLLANSFFSLEEQHDIHGLHWDPVSSQTPPNYRNEPEIP